MNGASQQQLNQGTKAGIIIYFSSQAGSVPALNLFLGKSILQDKALGPAIKKNRLKVAE